jgi:predicted phage tail protein
MTTIIFHGLIAQKFGKKIKLHLGKLNDFVIAIDAIKEGFRNFLLKLNAKNQGYSVHFEKNGKEIHLIPTISGSGRTLMIIVAVILIIIAVIVAWYLAPAWGPALAGLLTGSAAGVTGGAAVVMAAAAIAFSVGVNLLITALRMPSGFGSSNATGQAMLDTGGSTSTIEPEAKSFVFDNLQNAATQGEPLPIGYGRMKIGSYVINVSKKSYSFDQIFNDEISPKNVSLTIYD